jgi:hypothetical protein
MRFGRAGEELAVDHRRGMMRLGGEFSVFMAG